MDTLLSDNSFNNLLKNDAFIESLTESEQIFIIVWNIDGSVIWLNRYVKKETGFIDSDYIKDIRSFIPACTSDRIVRKLYTEGNTNSFCRYGAPVICSNGRQMYISWQSNMIDYANKKYILSVGVNFTNYKAAQDELQKANLELNTANEELIKRQKELTELSNEVIAQKESLRVNLEELQKSKEELQKSEERYRLVLEGSNDILWDWDIINDTAFLSSGFSNILELNNNQVAGFYEKWINKIHREDVQKVTDALETHIQQGTSYFSCEYRVKLTNGKYCWYLSRAKVLYNSDGVAIRMAGSHTDISARKETETKLKKLAYYDKLTDASLRDTFTEKVNIALKDVKRSSLKAAVMFLDIDNFKSINDKYGHHTGDRFLKIIVKIIKSCLEDNHTLSRMGGDEFAILIPEYMDQEYVTGIGNNILRKLEKPLKVFNHSLNVSVSIGVAVYPEHGKTCSELIKNADKAMYKVKESGKNNIMYFNCI